jgi:hypothetical protein
MSDSLGGSPDVEGPDADMVPVLRAMSGAQRVQLAFDLWRFAWQITWCSERGRHPELDEAALNRRVAERMGRATE